jgi:large subunit ribosomal protein L13
MKIKRSKNQPERKWYLVDAKSQVLGRLASKIATLLMGKNKVNFSFHDDVGDYVVVINSDKLRVTGKKKRDKVYYRHTGYPGGLKEATLGELLSKDSRKVIRFAVSGMLPKNKLRKQRLKRLKVYHSVTHPYQNKKLIKVD